MAVSNHFIAETVIRVRYAETDAMGIVHHASYIVYFEEGRTNYARQRGHDYASFERSGESFLTFLSRHMSADDAAALLSEFANASSSMNFQIWEHQENLSMKPGE